MDARRIALPLAVALLPFLGGIPLAAASTVVSVSLWDKGAAMEMSTGLTYGTPGIDPDSATMGIKAAPATAKAGVVTFKVKNDSKDTIHEMILMYLADPSQPLPYVEGDKRVDEDKAGDKGEVSELDPGKSGSLTVNLKAGTYLLICNVAGHFAAGMWTTFTVTP
jgi:uncharacterized cupredoxin-like copper-binding protein